MPRPSKPTSMRRAAGDTSQFPAMVVEAVEAKSLLPLDRLTLYQSVNCVNNFVPIG